MKYLYEVTDADFSVKNRREESAIQLAIIYNKNKTHVKLKSIIKYLVEVVDVDIAYNYEETLLVWDQKDVIEYIETMLSKYGVEQANKNIIEFKHAISK